MAVSFVGSFKVAYNVQGLALLGYLKNVSRQLKPNIVLKVEDKNKSYISNVLPKLKLIANCSRRLNVLPQ